LPQDDLNKRDSLLDATKSTLTIKEMIKDTGKYISSVSFLFLLKVFLKFIEMEREFSGHWGVGSYVFKCEQVATNHA
jgi:hypothetical protein